VSLSTHVLDASTGRPAAGVRVELRGMLTGRTDADGRCTLVPGDLRAGEYELSFDTGGYFAAAGVETFYPRVTVTFTVRDGAAHHHVPLLLSPWAYSTYRGS
jgi:5-hydroxyisourate hydrolase